MLFQRVKTPGLGHNAYVLGCGRGLAAVIDPRRDVDDYLRLARDNDLSISYVLETHRQEDFELGSRALAQATGAQIVGGTHPLFGQVDIALADGATLEVGTTRFVVLETPGHTPESVSYAVYAEDSGDRCWGAFTGDALFVGDTGRTDLPDPDKTGDNAGILYDSVHRKLAPLGAHTLIFPAHGAGSACGGKVSDRDDSSLGIEMATNPVFTKSRQDFIAHKLSEKMARPPYFSRMETVNLLAGRPLRPPACRLLQPAAFQQRMGEALVLDTRTPDAFAGAHIPSSYNVWLAGLSTFGGWIADDASPVLLVVDRPADIERAVVSLARIGIDSAEGVLAGGIENWREQGFPIDTLATISAGASAGRMREGGVRVLDVRDDYEWHEMRIPGAVHTYVGHLEKRLPSWPHNAEIVVHCSVGHRSGLAASILRRHGFTHVHNMLGGIKAWAGLGLPLERGSAAAP